MKPCVKQVKVVKNKPVEMLRITKPTSLAFIRYCERCKTFINQFNTCTIECFYRIPVCSVVEVDVIWEEVL